MGRLEFCQSHGMVVNVEDNANEDDDNEGDGGDDEDKDYHEKEIYRRCNGCPILSDALEQRGEPTFFHLKIIIVIIFLILNLTTKIIIVIIIIFLILNLTTKIIIIIIIIFLILNLSKIILQQK